MDDASWDERICFLVSGSVVLALVQSSVPSRLSNFCLSVFFFSFLFFPQNFCDCVQCRKDIIAPLLSLLHCWRRFWLATAGCSLLIASLLVFSLFYNLARPILRKKQVKIPYLLITTRSVVASRSRSFRIGGHGAGSGKLSTLFRVFCRLCQRLSLRKRVLYTACASGSELRESGSYCRWELLYWKARQLSPLSTKVRFRHVVWGGGAGPCRQCRFFIPIPSCHM